MVKLRSLQSVKMKKTSLQELRFVHAHTGESMVEILRRLISAELIRVKEEKSDGGRSK